MPEPGQDVIGAFTDGTRVLISFGAFHGGFEFALALRWAIYQKFGRNPQTDPAFVYLDAITLEAAEGTTYEYQRDSDTHMMRNPNWAPFYQAAIRRCSTMIFLLTQHWLKSKFCWEELTWFMANRETSKVKPVFVVFPDANGLLGQTQLITRHGNTVNPKRTWEAILRSGAARIHVSSVASSDIRNVEFQKLGPLNLDEGPGHLAYRYVTSDLETQRILQEVVV